MRVLSLKTFLLRYHRLFPLLSLALHPFPSFGSVSFHLRFLLVVRSRARVLNITKIRFEPEALQQPISS